MAQDLMLTASHIVAESTSILSTNFGGGHIYSVKISEDLDNGLLVCKDTYMGDEVWGAKDYVEGEEALLLLAPPAAPIISAKAYASEDKFYNAAGDIVRAYTLHIGDRISLSENAFATAPAVGNYVTYDASAKNYVVGAAAEGKFCAQVLAKIVRNNLVMYKIQVVSL